MLNKTRFVRVLRTWIASARSICESQMQIKRPRLFQRVWDTCVNCITRANKGWLGSGQLAGMKIQSSDGGCSLSLLLFIFLQTRIVLVLAWALKHLIVQTDCHLLFYATTKHIRLVTKHFICEWSNPYWMNRYLRKKQREKLLRDVESVAFTSLPS